MSFSLQKNVGEVFNMISQQSTAKPGCIIELDAITDFVSINKTQENGAYFKTFLLLLQFVCKHLWYLRHELKLYPWNKTFYWTKFKSQSWNLEHLYKNRCAVEFRISSKGLNGCRANLSSSPQAACECVYVALTQLLSALMCLHICTPVDRVFCSVSASVTVW